MNISKLNHQKILVILTGGTICSSTNDLGERYSDAGNVKIIAAYKAGDSPYSKLVHFDAIIPTDILSENMTISTWNTLLAAFRNKVNWSDYRGVIILHGTDTLAYTSSLLSVVLAGIPIPICMVSSQLPLNYGKTNGHANFRAAVELIMNNIAPNVYVVYRNSDGGMYVHYGAHLLQCANYSNDFFSVDAMKMPDAENAKLVGKDFETDELYLNKMGQLTPCVLQLMPYAGINYNIYSLEGIRAVVHGTYHSETVCVERKEGKGSYSNFSILHLMDRCKEHNIPLFLAPCSPAAHKYESTGDILASGASHISGMTCEMAYVKTLIGCALGFDNTVLEEFVNKSINYEIVY